ncbi:hypothetical protein JTB14_016427 [Gonioctena quinquepunctata]|nr:hypothetical protein JTB14_016427 [Gonioctena quinquepunctata]
MEKYLPYCPLWSCLVLSDSKPLSNSLVETFFSQIKNSKLKGEKNIKCSQFIRKLREDTLALKVESDLNIGKSCLTKNMDNFEEKTSQEVWCRKPKKHAQTHFDARFLRKYTQNDGMQRMHQVSKSLDSAQNDSHFDSKLDLHENCDYFLRSLKLSESGRKIINETMKTQRYSDLWRKHRKILVTSSFFGRVCRVKHVHSYRNIVKAIRSDDSIKTPAMKHGIDNEERAKNLYMQKTNRDVISAGQVVHLEYPFLGASPDGLIGDDGAIEIKCPYSAKNLNPENCEFDFLNKNGTGIKESHPYHYQIQGILEIINRTWCDSVIYTHEEGDLEGTVWDPQMGNCLTCFKEPRQTAQDETSNHKDKEVIHSPGNPRKVRKFSNGWKSGKIPQKPPRLGNFIPDCPVIQRKI